MEMNTKKNGTPYVILVLFNLPYRQTGGFVRALKRFVLGLEKPDHTTIHRHVSKLNLNLADSLSRSEQPVLIAIDASGVKVTNRGDWIREKWKRRKGYPKMPLRKRATRGGSRQCISGGGTTIYMLLMSTLERNRGSLNLTVSYFHPLPSMMERSILGVWMAVYMPLIQRRGALRWRFETDGVIFSSPTIADGVVYFGSNDNSLYALN